jgi:phage terminase small subunit
MANSLTDRRRTFIEKYVSGHSQTESAKLAGFADPKGEGYRLMQEPAVQAAIQAELVKRVQTEGQAIAFNFLINTIVNEKAPWSARTECARIVSNKGPLSDMALKAAYQPADKPMNEMSLSELEAFIKGGQAALEKAREQRALPAEFVDVTAQQSTDVDPK